MSRILTQSLVLLLAGGAFGQIPEMPSNVYLNVSEDARKRLELVDSYVRDGQWAEAVDVLQDVVERFPDKVIPLAPAEAGRAPEQFLNVRTVCHWRISTLPPQALKIYRERTDGPAHDLWERAKAASAEERWPLIERIADEFFCSSSGDQAIDRLGDRAMSQGDCVRAIYLWMQLLPPNLFAEIPQLPEPVFRFPDPQVDRARVAAKCVVAQLFRQKRDSALQMNVKLREAFPDAAGRLAGHEAPYWQTIVQLAATADDFKQAPDRAEHHTFAGNAQRSHIAPKPVDVGLVQWQWEVEERNDQPMRTNRFGMANTGVEEQLPYFPVVVGNLVHLATSRQLWTFDLDTGKADSWYNFEDDHVTIGHSRGDSGSFQTLTVDGDRLFVRAGNNPQVVNLNFQRRGSRGISKLYCFDPKQQRLIWVKDSNEITDQQFTFEGAPVVRGRSVYVALTRTDATIETNVACLDRDTGELRWRTFICESTNEVLRDSSNSHNLLTLAGDTIFYSTNLGSVAAVNADTGRIEWVSRYNRREVFGRRATGQNNLSPCVYHDGRVYVAASDTEKIQCFDALTGKKLWDAGQRVDELLGVAHGTLIATGGRVWGIDVETGKRRWYWPENDVTGYGRGVLAGDYVYWPTINEIHVLEQRTGRVARPPIALYERLQTTGGNIILGDGYMLLAQSHKLVALFPYRRLIEKLQKQLVEHPDSAQLHMKLAQAAFDNKDFLLASEHFAHGQKHAKPEQILDGKPLVALAQQRRFESYLRMAQHLASQGNFADADLRFADALQVAPQPEQQVQCLKEQVQMWADAKQPAKAVQVLQSVLDRRQLAEVLTEDPGGQRRPAAYWAKDAIDRFIASDGPEVYAPIDTQVAELFSKERDPDRLVLLAQRFPNAKLHDDIVLAAADKFLENHRYRDARLLYKQVAFQDPGDERVMRGLLGLRECCEALGLSEPERAILARLQKLFGDKRLPDGEQTVRQLVQSRREALAQLDAAGVSDQPVVVKTLWQRDRDEGSLHLPTGLPPSPAVEGLLRESRKRLFFCSLQNSVLWEAPLDGRLQWAAYGTAGLLIGTGHSISCLGYESGNVLWSQTLSSATVEWVAFEDPKEPVDDPEVQFLLAGDTVLCLTDDRLIAFDGDRGSPVWAYAMQGAPDGPLLAAGTAVIASDRTHLHVVDRFTGSPRFKTLLQDHRQASVILVGDRLVFTPLRHRIVAYDLMTDRQLWSKELRTPNFSWPAIYSSDEELFVVFDGSALMKLDASTGTVAWNVPLRVRPTPWEKAQATLHHDGLIYIRDGWLECRELKDGKLRWRLPIPGEDITFPVQVGRSTMLVGKTPSDVYLLAVRTNNGSPSQLFRLGSAPDGATLTVAGRVGIVSAGNAVWGLHCQTGSMPSPTGEIDD